MLHAQISEALKDAVRAKEERAPSTLRLILAALKDRDIAARGKGEANTITDDELVLLLQSMIKQRHDRIAAYRAALPDRFPVAAGIVEPRDGEASLAEIERCAPGIYYPFNERTWKLFEEKTGKRRGS